MITLDFGAVLSQWPQLLRGAAFTVGLTAVSAGFGLAAWVAIAGLLPTTRGAALGSVDDGLECRPHERSDIRDRITADRSRRIWRVNALEAASGLRLRR